MAKPLSIIIPVYNEAATILGVLDDLRKFLDSSYEASYEIIVVNDGSSDATSALLQKVQGITLLEHGRNRGYGASLKTGILRAKFSHVLFYDADGQFDPRDIAKLVPYADTCDLVSGARIKDRSSLLRKPGKKLLHMLVNFLLDKKIPDLNCGFRIVKKDAIKEFWHFLPDSFSFSTTTVLAFDRAGLSIQYVPIEVRRRAGGKSEVKVRHAFKMFFTILRTIALFSPFRVFMPPALFLFLFGSISLVYDLIHVNINDFTILLFVSALIIFFFGLLADQLVLLRWEVRKMSKESE